MLSGEAAGQRKAQSTQILNLYIGNEGWGRLGPRVTSLLGSSLLGGWMPESTAESEVSRCGLRVMQEFLSPSSAALHFL